jgi:hypothetical protein
MTQKQKNQRKTRKNTRKDPTTIETPKHPSKSQPTNPKQHYITARALLLLPWLKPRLLTSKLISHSRFFSSLFPLILGVEIEPQDVAPHPHEP